MSPREVIETDSVRNHDCAKLSVMPGLAKVAYQKARQLWKSANNTNFICRSAVHPVRSGPSCSRPVSTFHCNNASRWIILLTPGSNHCAANYGSIYRCLSIQVCFNLAPPYGLGSRRMHTIWEVNGRTKWWKKYDSLRLRFVPEMTVMGSNTNLLLPCSYSPSPAYFLLNPTDSLITQNRAVNFEAMKRLSSARGVRGKGPRRLDAPGVKAVGSAIRN